MLPNFPYSRTDFVPTSNKARLIGLFDDRGFAVFSSGLGNEPIVSGIVHWTMKVAVQMEDMQFVVVHLGKAGHVWLKIADSSCVGFVS
jgi:hypothetical protein